MGFSFDTVSWMAFAGLLLGGAAFWNTRINSEKIDKLWDEIHKDDTDIDY